MAAVRKRFGKQLSGMGKDVGRLNASFAKLGRTAGRSVGREFGALPNTFGRVRRAGTDSAKQIARAQALLRARTRELRLETGGLTGAYRRLGASASLSVPATIFGAAAIAGAVAFTRQVVRASDTLTRLSGQITLVTDSQEQRIAVEKALFDIAQGTRAEYESTVTTFTRLSRSTKNIGASQAEVLAVTRAINQASKASGTTAQEAAAAAIQLGQGLASGVLQGEELRSVLENTPRIATAIAEGLGVGVFQLRQMSKEGTLTSEKVFAALLSQTGKIAKEFEQLPVTASDAIVQFGNQLQKSLGAADAGPLVEQIQNLTKFIADPAVSESLTQLGTGMLSLVSSALEGLPKVVEALSSFGTAIRLVGTFFNSLAESTRNFFGADSLEEYTKRQLEIDAEFWAKHDEIVLGSYRRTEDAAEDAAATRKETAETAGAAEIASVQAGAEAAIAAADVQTKAEQKAAAERVKAEGKALDEIATLRRQASEGFAGASGRGGSGLGLDAGVKTTAEAYEALSRVIAEVTAAQKSGDAEALRAAQARVAAVAQEVTGLDNQIAKKDLLGRLENEYTKAANGAADALQSQVDRSREAAEKPSEITLFTDGSIRSIEVLTEHLDRLRERAEKPFVVTFQQRGAPNGAPAPAAAPGFSFGTILRGYGGGDRLAALLEAGEAVIPKESVRANLALVRQLIAQRGRLPGFNLGAIIGPTLPSLPTAPSVPTLQPINVAFPDGQSFELMGTPEQAGGFSEAIALNRLARKYGARTVRR